MEHDALQSGLRRFSSLALAGPARFEWKHALPGRKTDPVTGAPFTRRLSITFRTVLARWGFLIAGLWRYVRFGEG
jgi:hypothetical protein